jgi:hypothetical protein
MPWSKGARKALSLEDLALKISNIFGIAALKVKQPRHDRRAWIEQGEKSVGDHGGGWTENGTFPGRFYIGGCRLSGRQWYVGLSGCPVHCASKVTFFILSFAIGPKPDQLQRSRLNMSSKEKEN